MNPENVIDNWMEKERKKPTKDADIQRTYSEQVIAWIDILGMKSLISTDYKDDASKVISIMNNLGSYVYNANDDIDYKFNVYQIADGVMIATDLKYCELLCRKLAEIQWKVLINDNLLLRGAVTVGSISIGSEEPRIIGPAYVDVYNLESNYAVYPRILLSQICVDTIRKGNNTKRLPEYIKEDFDKNYFVDYIAHAKSYVKEDLLKNTLLNGDALRKTHDILNGLDKQNLRIRQKHGWFMNLLEVNNIIEERNYGK